MQNAASLGAVVTLGASITDGVASSQDSNVNSDYVTAESAGASPLIANRTAIGPWEEFDPVSS